MKSTGIHIKGYRISKAGKVEKIAGYGLDASAKIAKRKNANKPRLVSRRKAGTAK